MTWVIYIHPIKAYCIILDMQILHDQNFAENSAVHNLLHAICRSIDNLLFFVIKSIIVKNIHLYLMVQVFLLWNLQK